MAIAQISRIKPIMKWTKLNVMAWYWNRAKAIMAWPPVNGSIMMQKLAEKGILFFRVS